MTKYDMVTWRKLIERNMSTYKNEDWAKVKACTLTEDELDVEFYEGRTWKLPSRISSTVAGRSGPQLSIVTSR